MQYEDQWMIYSIFIKEKQFNNSDQSEFNFHFHSFHFSFIILLSRRELLVSLVHCIRQVYEHSSPLFVSLLISISFNFFPFSISMLFIVLELALSNRESYIFVINQGNGRQVQIIKCNSVFSSSLGYSSNIRRKSKIIFYGDIIEFILILLIALTAPLYCIYNNRIIDYLVDLRSKAYFGNCHCLSLK